MPALLRCSAVQRICGGGTTSSAELKRQASYHGHGRRTASLSFLDRDRQLQFSGYAVEMSNASILPPKGLSYSTFPSPSPPDDRPPPPPPYLQASWLSRATFGWVSPLMDLGNSRALVPDDLWPLAPKQTTGAVATSFDSCFSETRSISRSFFRVFGARLAFTGLAFVVATVGVFVGPVVLHEVVDSLAAKRVDLTSLTLWVLGLFTALVLRALANNYAIFQSQLIAMELAAALKSLLYRKSIRLDATARKRKATGDIVSLYSTDCMYVIAAADDFHKLWIIPLQVVVLSGMLYHVLGIASFAGVATLLVVLVCGHSLASTFQVVYSQYSRLKDARMARVTAIFNAMSAVKFNAWEEQMNARIGAARQEEVAAISTFLRLIIANSVLTWGMPLFTSVATFGVHAGVLQRQLSAAKVFTSLALFQLLQIPLRDVANMISTLTRARVSTQRITEFLALPEVQGNPNDPRENLEVHVPAISIRDATFSWDDTTKQLEGVNLEIQRGELVVVHGSVGSNRAVHDDKFASLNLEIYTFHTGAEYIVDSELIHLKKSSNALDRHLRSDDC
ncbi:hypothetical protein ATCC90586_005372 [Pythium insidiosum]|nr:hypothetical protein ATCC90586_005372 [Pythium insidiosum]